MSHKDQDHKERADHGPNVLLQKARDLHSSGMDWSTAVETAFLESRIGQWPKDYGDDLQVLIYGDFEPPKSDLHFQALGIRLFPENLKNENTVISQSAPCVLKANVRVSEKTVPGVVDAVRRINILLGVWTVVHWGQAACGWWSWVTHGSPSETIPEFTHAELKQVSERVVQLPDAVKRKLESAFYWIREPRQLFMDFHKPDLLRIFAGYWNAFECLVDAVGLLKPQGKLTNSEKERRIDELFSKQGSKPTAGFIEKAYTTIVNPAFPGKAKYALAVC